MYNVSDAYLEAIKRPVIKYSITGTIGSNNFNAYTIKEGSFQISNQCTDTNELSLGSCAIGQLKATFCDVSIIRNEWLDKVITPSCKVEVSEGQYESVPLGVFTIKQAEQTAEGVQVTAYDNMFKFDKLFDATDKDFDKTGKPYYFLNKICQKCGVTLGMTQNEVNALPNGDNTMYICGVRNGTTDYANDIETYRDALFYLAQACACFATINRLGRLELRPFRQSVTDYISDTDRLAGAEFADYVTSFTGIYVDSLYDGRTTYYGYDLEKLQENLAEYTERKEEEEDVVDEDEADIAEIQEKYDQGQITEEEYTEQMAAATKKLKEDEAKLKATNKYLNWLNKAIAKAQANAQGTIMDLEGNPFLQHRDTSIRSIAKVTTATELRTTIMRRLSKMEYVPFSCSSVFGIHYDLGDRIMFTDGHADDDLGCITAFDWTYNGEYSMYGYGANPDEATVRPKIEKAMKQANENALNRPDLELVELEDSEGDPKPVALRKRKPFSEETATGDFWVSKTVYIWSYYKYSAGSVPQSGITKVKVSCTTNFALCAIDPGHDVYPGDQDNIVAGIKRHDLIINFVAIQIPANELDSYELPKIKFECTRVYAPDPEHALDVTPQTFSVPEGQDTMEMTGYKTVQDPENPYQYWRLPLATIQYGAVAHGIAEEFPQASLDFYFNSINAWNAAGVIFLDTIPNIEPGDIVLPTASGQKQTAADVENIARKIAGAGSDPDEYVSPSYFDSVSVGGDVDVENQAMAGQIGQSLEKIFENLNECIRKIYKPTEEGGITVDYPEYYYHGGSANRLFNRVDYEGHDYATIGSDVPTLIADEYTRQELTALPGGTHLEDRYASGKTYIRVGDKSGMRLVGEAGQNKAHANEPYSYYLWDNHKTTRALESTGYRIDSYRVDGSSNAQYIAYRLTGIEGGKTYNISFDFGVLPSERPPGHESDIYFSADDTKAFGMLLTTNPSFNDFGSLPVDSDIWHDDDPDNMYYAFAGSFTPVTAASLPHYEFSFTAQEGKSYYIFFVTCRLSSEIQSGTYTYTMHMKLRNFISSEGLGLIDAEISFCNNPSVSSGETWFKWNFTNGGGGGTSDLDAIEITYAEYQLLTPEEKADPDKIYFITDYPTSGGSLEELSDVDIDDETLSDGQVLTYDDTDDKWKNTDVDDVTPTITEASVRANLASGDSLKTIIGKIKKWFSDLKDLAFTAIDGASSTKYLRGDGTWQAFPTIPTVNNATLTIQKNGTTIETFTANASSNKTANISVPTKLSDLTNDLKRLNTNTAYEPSANAYVKPTSNAIVDFYTVRRNNANIAIDNTVYGGTLLVTNWNSGNGGYNAELYIGMGDNPDLYFRGYNTNSYTSWKKVAFISDIPSSLNCLPLAGGNMTGASGIQFPTTAGNNKTGNWISAGGGYSTGTGKNGVKLICCEQSDCISGIGQDLTSLPSGYELTIVAGQRQSDGLCYISFAKHSVNTPKTYTRLGYFNGSGDLYTTGDIYEGGTALSSTYLKKDGNSTINGKITFGASDAYGIYPSSHNKNTIGSVDKSFFEAYFVNVCIGKQSTTAGVLLFYSNSHAFYSKILNNATLTANRTLTLPDASGTISVSGSSSIKTKKNVTDMTDEEAEKLLSLRPVNYDYKNEKNGTNCYGLIAEEVQEAGIDYPVFTMHDDMLDEDVPALDYAKFVPYLIKMVQKQQKQIETMQKQIDELMEIKK